MYIPAWLIVLAVVIGGIYFYNRSKKRSVGVIAPINNMSNIFKQPFSYKLDIHIEPNWYNIYKKICTPKSEKEWEKMVEQKIKSVEKDNSSSLWGRRYYLTEYYDSASGLTTKFQKVLYQNGEQYFYPVDEFGDSGYIFESDSSLHLSIRDKNYEKKKSESDKLSIQVGEDFIRNDIFDKHIGGPKRSFDYEKENYLFSFPLYEVFNFLFALGQRFYGTERNTVVKWPDHIEKKFEETGIKYETQFEGEPTLFEIEKHDKEFFEEWGKPKISLYGESIFEGGYLRDKDGTYYSISLKVFRPNENDRIGELSPRTN